MLDRTRKRLAVGVLCAPLLAACTSQTELDRVLESGELRVLTRNAATTYYEGPTGPTGLEYDLAKGFADQLGVELKVVNLPTVVDVLEQLRARKAHFAAAGLTVTDERRNWARFTPPYQEVNQQLVYRIGSTAKPEAFADLKGELEVIAGSSHEERLRALKPSHPELRWRENSEVDAEELLTRVSEQQIAYTIVDSNSLLLNQRFFPEVRAAFAVSEPESLAWAFPKGPDDSLYRQAVAYFEGLQANGRLDQLLERHYGHIGEFDYVGTRTFMRHVRDRLPHYREMLERAGRANELDWRLLAAMAYQESHWNPKAVSPTGVRGFMMLTRATADYLGVEKRTDVWQSIEGGARYIRDLIERVPERIADPDRMWMAMAAYNVGFYHLEDARIITESRGGDPDQWKDVKENLPLLRKRDWYSRTKHGYARGNEAVIYVENIRSYYDILSWLTDEQRPLPQPPRDNLVTLNAPLL